MTTVVTIAIPTFNRADRFLRAAIDAALAQSWQDLEVIVADNCSDDDTPDVVRSYDDDRLRYVRHSENIGANSNFNYCINNAAGDYFLLLPDDDLIDPDMVESCMEAIAGNRETGVIRTGTRLLDGTGKLIREMPNTAAGLSYNEVFHAWMRGEFTSYVCSTLFNTRLLREVGGFQSRHGLFQDLMAVARVIARGGHCDVKAVKAGFRRHEANYGNMAELLAWCEDGRQLAEVLRDEAPGDQEALYEAAMSYLCLTVYGYARRFLRSPIERLRAYRMIDAQFGHRYTPLEFMVLTPALKKLKTLRRGARSLRATVSFPGIVDR